MNRFNRIKTIQMIVLIMLTVIGLVVIFRDRELYAMLGANSHVKLLGVLLWIVLGLSFAFLYYDFHSYSSMKRENTELDHAIFSDALTGVGNRYSVDVYLSQFLNKPLPADMGCVTLDLTNLAEINEKQGHGGGDAAIQAFSDILKQASTGACFIGRNGGNKFLAIMRDCSHKRIDTFLETVERLTADRNAANPDGAISYSAGFAFDEGETAHTLTELVALSDRRAWQQAAQSPNA